MEDVDNRSSSRAARTLKSASGDEFVDRKTLYPRYLKRVFDITFSLIVSPIVLLLVIVLAVLIYLSDRRNPFFAHKRVGQNGRMFGCLKLRTMVVGAETMLPELLDASPERREEWTESQKLTDDPRVTRLGAILRKTSLDEIQQLLNVLRGDMSLVGPRPIVPDELRRYGPHASTYLRLRPGVTGMWQTTGRNDVSYVERVRMDVEYEKNISLWMDIKIMLMTILSMLSKTGR